MALYSLQMSLNDNDIIFYSMRSVEWQIVNGEMTMRTPMKALRRDAQ